MTICKKYCVPVPERNGMKFKEHRKALRSRLIENQFRLHIDTQQLRKNIQEIKPTDIVSITNKIHGTSWIVGNVLTKKKLSIAERVMKFFGVPVVEAEYDIVYSSRGVIKNQWDGEEVSLGFYKYDLWKDIADRVREFIPKGFTLYGEAVGQLPNGTWIQRGYSYGAQPNTFDIYVYRITFTNSDGKAVELSHAQIKQFCDKHGLKHMQEFYYGEAFGITEYTYDWHNTLLAHLEAVYIKDRMCPLNDEKVPEEGIVVRVDDLYEFKAFKLKNFLFLGKETKDLDAGIIDTETMECENA